MAGDQLLRPLGEPTRRDWIAVMSVMLGAFMAVLDIQITNSSLSAIGGALGASAEEGSWISTAHLMAEIIVIPLTGWLGSVFGLRRYLSVNTVLFVGFSIACALVGVITGTNATRSLRAIASSGSASSEPAGKSPNASFRKMIACPSITARRSAVSGMAVVW